MNTQSHIQLPTSRRDFLTRAGGGFGALALTHLLATDRAYAKRVDPLAPKVGHLPVRAKNVIFVFLQGGPSHIDTFDPKPALNKYAGQPLPEGYVRPVTAMGESGSPLLASPRKWKQHGQSGLWVSDWLPHIAQHVDKLAVVRSCHADGLNHVGSVCQMNTGSILAGRPSIGAWSVYGLGTANQNLPAFVVLLDSKTLPHGGVRNWGTGFMPATYQGTLFNNGPQPIANLNNPKGVTDERQRQKLDLLASLNRRHLRDRQYNTELEARIGAYELAYRMQAEAPEAVDLNVESDATKSLYGLDEKPTAEMGRACLMARRLVERGVRFVQVYSGAGNKWDSHSNHEKKHGDMCHSMDKPVAGLLSDLQRRGLLDDTLVVWGGEFGRTPMSEKGNGRDHNPFGFTMFFAGAGVRGGQTIGETDDMGLWAVDQHAHVSDIHATILNAMGLDHMKLEYKHGGLLERPTLNVGDTIPGLFA
ncbi:MAG: DUF1501 domain-containing protein [Planctomycetota bacterium]